MSNPAVPKVPGVDECAHPTFAELVAECLRTERREDGPLHAVEWKCTNRAAHASGRDVTNPPIDNMLLKLPALFCKECKSVNPAGYQWSITDLTVRRIPLDFLVQMQGPFNTCVAHAFVGAMDLKRRIDGAMIYGVYIGHPLSITDFFVKYHRLYNTPFGYEAGAAHHLGYHRRECVLHIAQTEGVRYDIPSLRSTSYMPADIPSTHNTLVMKRAFRVPSSDVELIVRLLAAGFPLVACAPAGRTFSCTSGGGEIYDGGMVPVNHCVLLIGSGVANYPGNPTERNRHSWASWPENPAGHKGGPRIYVRARGSWDDTAHGVSARDGRGGDFNIWVNQLESTLWGFHLPPPPPS